MTALKLYGIPLSQPFRSVAWTLLQGRTKFDVEIVVPGATTGIGSLNEAYLCKTRHHTGKIPILQDRSFVLSESPAILSYLCERYGLYHLYGAPGSEKKAVIDSYMHWHHSGTRNLARLTFPLFRPEKHATIKDEDKIVVEEALRSLEDGWLSDQNYIAGGNSPSIADILAYEEVIGLVTTGMFPDLSSRPNIRRWINRMQQLPFHKEAHVALEILRNICESSSDTPLGKRLAAANKQGIKALKSAQEGFDKVTSKL